MHCTSTYIRYHFNKTLCFQFVTWIIHCVSLHLFLLKIFRCSCVAVWNWWTLMIARQQQHGCKRVVIHMPKCVDCDIWWYLIHYCVAFSHAPLHFWCHCSLFCALRSSFIKTSNSKNRQLSDFWKIARRYCRCPRTSFGMSK